MSDFENIIMEITNSEWQTGKQIKKKKKTVTC